MRVIAEHPVDMVRDQYLRQIADRCRVDLERLRPLVSAAQRGEESPAPAVGASPAVAPRYVTSASRPGRAALALMIHVPESVDGRFEACYFIDSTQRTAFEALANGDLVAEAVDALDRRDEVSASDLIREISVEELGESLFGDREITSVVHQLIRASATEALKEVDRDLRAGLVTPDSALTVIRDVKRRIAELEGPQGSQSEADLREWLVAREDHDVG